MRHPRQFKSSGAEIYRAAIDMARWADERGFWQVAFGEHHQAEDGFMPTPLVFAAALGGVTSRIRVSSVIISPLYHPIRLAEEIAVADLCLGGRLSVSHVLGYVEADSQMFGEDFHRRGDALDALIPLLRTAWTGKPFSYKGQTVTVQPRPVQDPFPIIVGGMSRRGIERAVELADGYHPPGTNEHWDQYRTLMIERGRKDPGPFRVGPMFIWVTTEPKDDVWKRFVPHIKHQVETYRKWSPSGQALGPWEVDFSKPGGTYQVLTPDETLQLADDLGPEGELTLTPLLSGIDPDAAWEMLDTFDRLVLPSIRLSDMA